MSILPKISNHAFEEKVPVRSINVTHACTRVTQARRGRPLRHRLSVTHMDRMSPMRKQAFRSKLVGPRSFETEWEICHISKTFFICGFCFVRYVLFSFFFLTGHQRLSDFILSAINREGITQFDQLLMMQLVGCDTVIKHNAEKLLRIKLGFPWQSLPHECP